MSILVNRRRIVISGGQPDIFAKYIKIRTRNVTSGKNITAAALSTIDKMFVDGIEITPTTDYVFSDDGYHDVYILFKNTTSIPDSAFWVANFTINYIDIPDNYINFGTNSIRNLGGSQKTTVIIRSTTYPTFEDYNNIGHKSGNLYVPDNLYDMYLANPLGFSNRIYRLSELDQ